MNSEVKIMADAVSTASCKFTVDRPVFPERSFNFADKERSKGSPLAERLFEIEEVSAVLISHDQVMVTKKGMDEWPPTAKKIGLAIREHLATGQAAVSDDALSSVPPAEEIRAKVQQVFEEEINPAVASHGGVIQLIDVKDNVVYIQMGGGCQGCGMADVTLKQGIETAIRAAIPEVGDILDVTDHAAGRNPYYTPSQK